MKVAVLGAGVIGVASAYYLWRRGHEVVVYDRGKGPGLETSFANAGQVSWGSGAPWAGPGVPRQALHWLLARHAPLVIRPRADPAMARFLWASLRNCTAARHQVNRARMVRLARYSAQCLAALREETGIAYDAGQRGTLQLFRDQRSLDRAAAESEALDALGVPHRLLDRAECQAVEPGLRRGPAEIAGGRHFPADETGDCFKFTTELAAWLRRQGVMFRVAAPIERLLVEHGRVAGMIVAGRRETADAYVVALGSHSPALLRPLGIDLPVYPVKGYSLTLAVADDAAAPISTVMDETHKVAVTRLGGRIRVGGIAELSGGDARVHPGPCRTLRHVLEDLFPQGAGIGEMAYWAGLRAMTPEGVPVIGETPCANLFVNTGHGTLGWTMACGAGRVLADLVSGHVPDVGAADFSRIAGRW